MAAGGPMACLARQAVEGATVCDLSVIAESEPSELIVEDVVGNAADAVDEISSWAQALGYGRIWFPHGPVDLDPDVQLGRRGTRCDTCHTEWVDGSSGFWRHATSVGCFPSFCWVCGSLMAQWQPWDQGSETIELPSAEAEETLFAQAHTRRRGEGDR
jgi:hypothetical protein